MGRGVLFSIRFWRFFGIFIFWDGLFCGDRGIVWIGR